MEEEQTQAQKAEESFVKPAVTMSMEDATILTPESLQMAKEQNLDLLLNMGKYAVWSIDIDSVDMDTVTEVDMGITLGTENIPTETIEAILDGNKYLEFTLAHDGPFGFSPTLQIALDPMYQGWYANLFYYNEEVNSLEFICDAMIDSSGIAAFDMAHASSYVIIVSPASMSGVSAAVDAENHVARWMVIGVIVCIMTSVIGCGIILWRKRMQEEEAEEEEYEEAEEEEYEEIEEEEYEEAEYEETGEEEYEEIEEEEYEEAEYEETGEEEYEEIEEEEYEEAEYEETGEEEYEEIEEEEYEYDDEDDWIEDEDWQEPETTEKSSIDRFADDHAEDDWIDDDEWDIENDWIDDAEWERRKEA